MPVRVRPYLRRHEAELKAELKGTFLGARCRKDGHDWKHVYLPGASLGQNICQRCGAVRGPTWISELNAVVQQVSSGMRGGYTWTRDFKFDVDDPSTMEAVYKELGDDTLYVVARTNYRLSSRPPLSQAAIGRNEGVGLWRDDQGEIWADDIVLYRSPKQSWEWALNRARAWNQKFILVINGATKTHEFVAVT